MKAILRDEQEMKDSGIDWINMFPKSWNKAKLKQIGNYINGYAFKPEDWSSNGLPIIRIQDLTGSNSGEPNFFNGMIDKKYLVKDDDILVSWAATLDAFIWNKGNGWLNQHIFKAIPNKIIQKRFFFWILKIAMDNMNNDNKHGIVMQHVTTGLFNNYIVPLPNRDEQQDIANYLDDRCSKIDAIIAEAKASIEEYKELKQAVIYEAVTKGLDKNVEMKDSGNIWYGLIPKHWELHKVCWDYSVELGKMLDQKRISGKNLRPYLRNADIKWDNINFKDLPEMDFGEDELDRYNVQPGDLMICEGGEIGKCNIVPQDCPKGIYYQKALHRVRAYKSSVSKYLRYLIMFLSKSGYINDSAQKATIFHLPAEKLKALRIPAPSVKEQTDIVTYLDVRTGDIDNLILEKHFLIEDLEAYKKSLIYEVVTGKRKVVA